MEHKSRRRVPIALSLAIFLSRERERETSTYARACAIDIAIEVGGWHRTLASWKSRASGRQSRGINVLMDADSRSVAGAAAGVAAQQREKEPCLHSCSNRISRPTAAAALSLSSSNYFFPFLRYSSLSLSLFYGLYTRRRRTRAILSSYVGSSG